MAVTFASFHTDGNTFVSMDLLEVNIGASTSAASCNSGVANSILGGGAHIHIFEFTDHENNRFQKKLIAQNMNI